MGWYSILSFCIFFVHVYVFHWVLSNHGQPINVPCIHLKSLDFVFCHFFCCLGQLIERGREDRLYLSLFTTQICEIHLGHKNPNNNNNKCIVLSYFYPEITNQFCVHACVCVYPHAMCRWPLELKCHYSPSHSPTACK